MTKISLNDLKTDIAAEASKRAADDRRRSEEYAANLRLRHETSPGGVGVLMCAARLDSLIEGFPSRIKLGSSNGRGYGVSAARVDGVWRLEIDPSLPPFQSADPIPVSGDIVWNVVTAMGLEVNGVSRSRVADLMEFHLGDIDAEFPPILALLPAHARTALAGMGQATSYLFGMSVSWIDALAAGRILGACLASGVRFEDRIVGKDPIVFRLATDRNTVFLREAINHGARLDVDVAGYPLVHAVVENGTVEAFDLLMDIGAVGRPQLDWTDTHGQGLLTFAARRAAAPYSRSGGFDMLEALISRGLDPYEEGIDVIADILKEGLSEATEKGVYLSDRSEIEGFVWKLDNRERVYAAR
jgi:hypothetical protein